MRGLAPETPLLVHDTDGYIFLDIDDTIIEVHGYQKEGSGYRYSGVRGLNVFLDALKTDVSVPIIISADHHRSTAPPRCVRVTARRRPFDP
ncbi:hypothetical protein E3N94_02120 [Cryobacterium sp. Sr3]|nr:hypothetical protein E3N94_02120 [Cryobacterium sp. Sr3]